MKKNYTFIILLAIVLLGAFLRFYKIGANSFVADEFLDMNSSYAYAETGEWKNWDFNLGKINEENEFDARDERAWAYKWQVAELFKFLKPTEGTARSVSALWGIISIILIFLVAKDFTKNKTIGLIAAFLLAISLDGIIFNRTLRMYAMFFPVFLGLSWALFAFLEKEYAGKNKFLEKVWKKWEINLAYLLPVLILGIIGFHLHPLTANIVFVLAAYVLILTIKKFKDTKKYLNKYSVILLGGILSFVAGIILIPSKMSIITKEITFTSHFSYIQKVLVDYQAALLAILFMLLGIYFLWKKEKLGKNTLWLSLSFLGILVLAIFFWKRNAGEQYIFFIQSFKIILISAGIYFVAIFSKENLTKWKNKPFWIAIILSLLLLPNFAYFFQENNTYNQNSRSDNPNYRSIFTYFMKKKGDSDVLITRNFRNYYFSGAKVKVFDFGGEIFKNKLNLEELQKIMAENPSGWIVLSDNDDVYLSSDASDYIEKNLEKINAIAVRGKASVYRWSN